MLDLFLEKIPHDVSVDKIKEHLMKIHGIIDVHHIHIWSMDGHHNYATMHIVANEASREIKESIREELREHGIFHATLELEAEGEDCGEEHCHVDTTVSSGHHHHHGHHHQHH